MTDKQDQSIIKFIMIQKMFLQIILLFFLLTGFIILYVKYYERRKLYYPDSSVEITPQAIGLNYEDIYFLTPGGVKLNAWFIKTKKPVATVLFLHGNAGNISNRMGIIQMFHEANFNFFIIDWRGYGESQGVPSERGFYEDALASYKYLVNEEKVPPGEIVIYGKSLGANVAVDLASRVKTGIFIGDSSFTSALDMGKELFSYIPGFLLKPIISVKFDALSKIKQVKIPKLIIHSRDDEIVPFSHGEGLFEQALPPKKFYVLKGPHNEAIFMDNNFISTVRNFVEEYSDK